MQSYIRLPCLLAVVFRATTTSLLLVVSPPFISSMAPKSSSTIKSITTNNSIMNTNSNANTMMMPTLKGVVFDMDDTLVQSNFDEKALYRKIFGTEYDSVNNNDNSNNDDGTNDLNILKAIDEIESVEEKDRAQRIIEETEEECRQRMTLMPGCVQLLSWLSAHQIPTALVTKNVRQSTDLLVKKLERIQQQQDRSNSKRGTNLLFQRIITRNDYDDNNIRIPPKPDPTALHILANECFKTTNGAEILMVGDSIVNDIGMGKNAGVRTALFTNRNKNKAGAATATSDDSKQEDAATTAAAADADIYVEHLTELPGQMWKKFEIVGALLGNNKEANQIPLHGLPPPIPATKLGRAVVEGDISLVRSLLLEEQGLEHLLYPMATTPGKYGTDESANTPLIWAAESGNVELVSLLVDTVMNATNSALLSAEELSAYVNHRGFLGATALNRAARRGHTPVLELMLSKYHHNKKYTTNDEEKINGNGNNDDNNATKLLFDVDLPNYKLQYPLHFAAFKRHPDTVDCLLRLGADPYVLDRKGRTPLEDTKCEACQSLLKEAMSK